MDTSSSVSVQRNNSWISYTPIATELDGLKMINDGMKIIWLEMTEGPFSPWRRDRAVNDEGCCCDLGLVLVAAGIWQLRVPLIIGVATCIFAFYSRSQPVNK